MDDIDWLVIGGGSGGVRAARTAAALGARVVLAEPRALGGTCVNVGCVPKKLFAYAAGFADDALDAESYGWQRAAGATPRFDWPTLVANKNAEIARLNRIYGELLAGSGVRVIPAAARVLDAHTVEAGGERLRARHILIATGCAPQRPAIEGAELGWVSDDVFHLPHLPARLVVVGGGYIATEFASIFAGLGVRVTQLHRGDALLRGFDRGLREHLGEEIRLRGVDLRLGAAPQRLARTAASTLDVTLDDGRSLSTDAVLFATGRRPALDTLGLDNTRVRVDARGFIEVDDDFQTAEPSIAAIGDVIGRVQLTPVALAEGMAIARRLFAPAQYRRPDYALIPTAVFSLPNVGTVGLGEDEALERGHRVQIFESRFRPLRQTLTPRQGRSLIKVVVDADNDRVLGCHMVGDHAGEIVQGLAVALQAGATKRVFDETLGIHPTVAEEFVTLRMPVRVRGPGEGVA